MPPPKSVEKIATFLKGILKVAKPEQLKTLRLIVSGAEDMPVEVEEMISRLGEKVQLIHGYGITECSPLLTMTC